METGIQTEGQIQDTTQNAQQAEEPKAAETFTQEDVDRIVQKRLAKFADYESLKEKAEKFDAAEEASKSDLQKAEERAAALQAELDALKRADTIRTVRDEVSKDKNVPAELLTGETKEECEAQADAILQFAKPTAYPRVRDGGEPTGKMKRATRDQFADWLNQNQGG